MKELLEEYDDIIQKYEQLLAQAESELNVKCCSKVRPILHKLRMRIERKLRRAEETGNLVVVFTDKQQCFKAVQAISGFRVDNVEESVKNMIPKSGYESAELRFNTHADSCVTADITGKGVFVLSEGVYIKRARFNLVEPSTSSLEQLVARCCASRNDYDVVAGVILVKDTTLFNRIVEKIKLLTIDPQGVADIVSMLKEIYPELECTPYKPVITIDNLIETKGE